MKEPPVNECREILSFLEMSDYLIHSWFQNPVTKPALEVFVLLEGRKNSDG